jgi:hypothetical protein
MRPDRVAIALSILALAAWGCGSSSTGTDHLVYVRPYRMGFSGIPPTSDFATAIASLQMWTRRADGAIFHTSPPWDSLLAGVPADTLIRRNELPLAQYFHSLGLEVVVTLDATDGLNRAQDAPQLVAAGRSLTEPAVQAAYRRYAVAIDTLLKPTRLGLAAETNLIRAAAPPALYAAVRQVANDAAADVRARDPAVREYVSLQVEVAWGLLTGGPASYVGVAQDIADYPFAQEFGLSSYPYLGGFAEPEDVPQDYYLRVRHEVGKNVLMVEGGWPSTSVGPVVSSPAKQARWIRREADLLGYASAVGWYQLTFADIGLSAFPPQPPGSILPLFATLGLVDTTLAPKPALAAWDSTFARRPQH